MSITKCEDCEKRIDIDIEDAIYMWGDNDKCLCEDCYLEKYFVKEGK